MRPSGSMPAQLMPAPQTTATPRGAASSRRPARRTAKVSLRTSTDVPQPRAAIAAESCCSSTGRSALARQAETWATGRCPAASWRG
ncbi:hypothetical protein SF12_21915 [Streptomyces sp. MBRL 601]|nr:hypothetical protein SF12_21915 [Streptomyces sp. MBRL 601]